MSQSKDGLSQSRGWLIFGGILSLLVGVFAISAPGLFSFVLTQLIGALCLVTGVISLVQALFGKNRHHFFLSLVSAIIRIAAGSALFVYTTSGMAALTLILAIVFLSEGIVCIATSLKIRTNPAWVWLLLNGIVALILGGMIYARWPVDAAWIVGLLYGIQSIFSGSAMLMLGFSAKPEANA
ncbi:MAG: HdeD family acid-resistance protein [Terrimicrobiaceae bacterium]